METVRIRYQDEDQQYSSMTSQTMTSFMKIARLTVVALILSGCSNEQKDQQIVKLQRQVDSLLKANKKLQETDEAYYRTGIDLLNQLRYKSAIAKFNELQEVFPDSKLAVGAKRKLEEINRRQEAKVKQLNSALKKGDLGGNIALLRDFVSQDYSDDIKSKASAQLDELEKQYAQEKAEMEAVNSTGVKLLNIRTGWEASGLFSSEIFAPVIRLTVKNVSEVEISKLEIRADFVNPSTKEVFGDASEYVVGYSDTHLKPGYSKSVILACGRGYKSYTYPPQLVADIYVDKTLYKTISIRRE
jgi:hypothetical protein